MLVLRSVSWEETLNDHARYKGRCFKDIVIEEQHLRSSPLSRQLVRDLPITPTIDVGNCVRYLFDNTDFDDFSASELPHIYPWFSQKLFFEAEVLGQTLPHAFADSQGSVEWVTDMQLVRLGYMIEPVSPTGLSHVELAVDRQSVAACMQIAAFMEPREGPVIAPQMVWVVAVGFDGRAVQSATDASIQMIPLETSGGRRPKPPDLDQMVRAASPVLTAALFAVMCGSAISTGFSGLEPIQDESHQDDQRYLLNTSLIEAAISEELEERGATLVQALSRRADMFPSGIPSRP